jgi:hypothetical protein
MGGTESLPEPCNPVKLGKLAYCSISIKSILERYEKRFHGAEIGPEETIFLKTLRNKKDTEQELPLVKFSDGQVAPLNLNDIRSQFKTAEQLLVPTSISELAFTRFPPIMLGAGIGFGRLFSYDWAF